MRTHLQKRIWWQPFTTQYEINPALTSSKKNLPFTCFYNCRWTAFLNNPQRRKAESTCWRIHVLFQSKVGAGLYAAAIVQPLATTYICSSTAQNYHWEVSWALWDLIGSWTLLPLTSQQILMGSVSRKLCFLRVKLKMTILLYGPRHSNTKQWWSSFKNLIKHCWQSLQKIMSVEW